MSVKQSNIDLNVYIKNPDIRQEFSESFLYITEQQELKNIVRLSLENTWHLRIIFEKSSLKNSYFDMMQYYSAGAVSIFNCNCQLDIFEKEFKDREKILIFNNVHKCNDRLIDYILNNKCILVC